MLRSSDAAVESRDLPGLPNEANAVAERHRLGAFYNSLLIILPRDRGVELRPDDRALLTAIDATTLRVRSTDDDPSGG